MQKMVSMRLWYVTKIAVTCVTELASTAQDFASNRLALLAFRGGDRKVGGMYLCVL
jgi:hypothetical protein